MSFENPFAYFVFLHSLFVCFAGVIYFAVWRFTNWKNLAEMW